MAIRKFNGPNGKTAWVLTHIDAVMTDDGHTLRDVLKSLTGFDPAYIAEMDNLAFTDDLVGFFASVDYDSANSRMIFKNGNGETVATFNAAPLIASGLLEDVTYEDGNLVFVFNIGDGHTKTITASVAEIFNLSNYYSKTETDALLSGKVDKEIGKGLSSNDFTNAHKVKVEQLIDATYDEETENVTFGHYSPVSYDENDENVIFDFIET